MPTCVICNERQATLKCKQCGKEICNPCAHKDANGAFCGLSCSQQFAQYLDAQEVRSGQAQGKKGGGLLGKVIIIVVIIVIGVAVLWKLGFISKKDVDKLQDAKKQMLEKGKEAIDKAQQK